MLTKLIINLGLVVLRLMSWLPLTVTGKLGQIIGVLAYYLAYKRRKIGMINLSLCFPQMSIKDKSQIIKRHFQYLATVILEYGLVFSAPRELIKKKVKLKNFDYLIEHYGKKPIILICPHFVGLDIGAIRLTLEVVGCSIYSKQKSEYMTNLLKKARTRFMDKLGGRVFSRQEGLIPLVRHLKKHPQVFYYLPDQDVGEKDSLYVPFFEFPTCSTIAALPKLISLTHAVVLGCSVSRLKDHYEMEFYKAWENYPTSDLREDIIRMNRFIEQVTSKNLAQYFWLHKRFKTQPDGRNKLYL